MAASPSEKMAVLWLNSLIEVPSALLVDNLEELSHGRVLVDLATHLARKHGEINARATGRASYTSPQISNLQGILSWLTETYGYSSFPPELTLTTVREGAPLQRLSSGHRPTIAALVHYLRQRLDELQMIAMRGTPERPQMARSLLASAAAPIAPSASSASSGGALFAPAGPTAAASSLARREPTRIIHQQSAPAIAPTASSSSTSPEHQQVLRAKAEAQQQQQQQPRRLLGSFDVDSSYSPPQLRRGTSYAPQEVDRGGVDVDQGEDEDQDEGAADMNITVAAAAAPSSYRAASMQQRQPQAQGSQPMPVSPLFQALRSRVDGQGEDDDGDRHRPKMWKPAVVGVGPSQSSTQTTDSAHFEASHPTMTTSTPSSAAAPVASSRNGSTSAAELMAKAREFHHQQQQQQQRTTMVQPHHHHAQQKEWNGSTLVDPNTLLSKKHKTEGRATLYEPLLKIVDLNEAATTTTAGAAGSKQQQRRRSSMVAGVVIPLSGEGGEEDGAAAEGGGGGGGAALVGDASAAAAILGRKGLQVGGLLDPTYKPRFAVMQQPQPQQVSHTQARHVATVAGTSRSHFDPNPSLALTGAGTSSAAMPPRLYFPSSGDFDDTAPPPQQMHNQIFDSARTDGAGGAPSTARAINQDSSRSMPPQPPQQRQQQRQQVVSPPLVVSTSGAMASAAMIAATSVGSPTRGRAANAPRPPFDTVSGFNANKVMSPKAAAAAAAGAADHASASPRATAQPTSVSASGAGEAGAPLSPAPKQLVGAGAHVALESAIGKGASVDGLSLKQRQLMRWLVNLGIIVDPALRKHFTAAEIPEEMPTSYAVPQLLSDGVLLSELVALLETKAGHRIQTMTIRVPLPSSEQTPAALLSLAKMITKEGQQSFVTLTLLPRTVIPKHGATSAGASSKNLELALGVLRQRTRVNPRHLWSLEALRSASDVAVAWELLEDIQKGYNGSAPLPALDPVSLFGLPGATTVPPAQPSGSRTNSRGGSTGPGTPARPGATTGAAGSFSGNTPGRASSSSSSSSSSAAGLGIARRLNPSLLHLQSGGRSGAAELEVGRIVMGSRAASTVGGGSAVGQAQFDGLDLDKAFPTTKSSASSVVGPMPAEQQQQKKGRADSILEPAPLDATRASRAMLANGAAAATRRRVAPPSLATGIADGGLPPTVPQQPKVLLKSPGRPQEAKLLIPGGAVTSPSRLLMMTKGIATGGAAGSNSATATALQALANAQRKQLQGAATTALAIAKLGLEEDDDDFQGHVDQDEEPQQHHQHQHSQQQRAAADGDGDGALSDDSDHGSLETAERQDLSGGRGNRKGKRLGALVLPSLPLVREPVTMPADPQQLYQQGAPSKNGLAVAHTEVMLAKQLEVATGQPLTGLQKEQVVSWLRSLGLTSHLPREAALLGTAPDDHTDKEETPSHGGGTKGQLHSSAAGTGKQATASSASSASLASISKPNHVLDDPMLNGTLLAELMRLLEPTLPPLGSKVPSDHRRWGGGDFQGRNAGGNVSDGSFYRLYSKPRTLPEARANLEAALTMLRSSNKTHGFPFNLPPSVIRDITRRYDKPPVINKRLLWCSEDLLKGNSKAAWALLYRIMVVYEHYEVMKKLLANSTEGSVVLALSAPLGGFTGRDNVSVIGGGAGARGAGMSGIIGIEGSDDGRSSVGSGVNFGAGGGGGGGHGGRRGYGSAASVLSAAAAVDGHVGAGVGKPDSDRLALVASGQFSALMQQQPQASPHQQTTQRSPPPAGFRSPARGGEGANDFTGTGKGSAFTFKSIAASPGGKVAQLSVVESAALPSSLRVVRAAPGETVAVSSPVIQRPPPRIIRGGGAGGGGASKGDTSILVAGAPPASEDIANIARALLTINAPAPAPAPVPAPAEAAQRTFVSSSFGIGSDNRQQPKQAEEESNSGPLAPAPLLQRLKEAAAAVVASASSPQPVPVPAAHQNNAAAQGRSQQAQRISEVEAEVAKWLASTGVAPSFVAITGSIASLMGRIRDGTLLAKVAALLPTGSFQPGGGGGASAVRGIIDPAKTRTVALHNIGRAVEALRNNRLLPKRPSYGPGLEEKLCDGDFTTVLDLLVDCMRCFNGEASLPHGAATAIMNPPPASARSSPTKSSASPFSSITERGHQQQHQHQHPALPVLPLSQQSSPSFSMYAGGRASTVSGTSSAAGGNGRMTAFVPSPESLAGSVDGPVPGMAAPVPLNPAQLLAAPPAPAPAPSTAYQAVVAAPHTAAPHAPVAVPANHGFVDEAGIGSQDPELLSLLRWLSALHIRLDNPRALLASASAPAAEFTDGTVLCRLITSLENMRGTLSRGKLSTVEWKPKAPGARLSNIRKALEVLRDNRAMPLDFLWCELQLKDGDPRVVRGLLLHIKRAYASFLPSLG